MAGLSGQVNLVWQAHAQFTSPYQGDNSLRPEAEQALSRVWTIFTGLRVAPGTELLVDIESAGGGASSTRWASRASRTSTSCATRRSGPRRTSAAAMMHLHPPLRRAPRRASARPPARSSARSRRVASRSAPASSAAGLLRHQRDRHRQPPAVPELDDRQQRRVRLRGRHPRLHARRRRRVRRAVWALRFGEMLMPTVANGIDYDFNLAHARAREPRARAAAACRPRHRAQARLPEPREDGQLRRGDRGALVRRDRQPDIDRARARGRIKYGFGAQRSSRRSARSRAVRARRAGTTARTSRSRTPRSTTRSGRRRRARGTGGIARTTGSGSPGHERHSRRRIARTSRSAATASCSATASCATAARTSSRPTTPRISTAACSRSTSR